MSFTLVSEINYIIAYYIRIPTPGGGGDTENFLQSAPLGFGAIIIFRSKAREGGGGGVKF